MIVPLWCAAGAFSLACNGAAGVEQPSAGATAYPYQSSGAALRTVFTDSALYHRFCELPTSGRPDYNKCQLRDQGRGPLRVMPPGIQPYRNDLPR